MIFPNNFNGCNLGAAAPCNIHATYAADPARMISFLQLLNVSRESRPNCRYFDTARSRYGQV
jgi:hypothetical protein